MCKLRARLMRAATFRVGLPETGTSRANAYFGNFKSAARSSR